MILFYLIPYSLFLVLFHSALLHFCPDLSFVTCFFKALFVSWLWAYDSQVVWTVFCFVCLDFGFVCSWRRARSHCCGGILSRVLQNGLSALSEALKWSTMSQEVLCWAESESVADLLLVFSPGYYDTWYQQLLSWGFGKGKWFVCLFVCCNITLACQCTQGIFPTITNFSSRYPVGTWITSHCRSWECAGKKLKLFSPE